ncbi:uncharacterized protein [Hyperolius riggenbachi]|uniref:uncharacterized protein n=1 Tax=Hyperolius riggenbachi TaxID=752182 RepID=UPI0035A2D91E
MGDPGATPMSRKQRLMAALEEEGDSELLYCFICGGGVPRGREVRLPVRCPARDGCPFFPFLQQQEPAPGAEPLSPGGCARVCLLCQRFLGAQWDSFERSRTPLEKRMYWLKRPYQCGEGGARAHPRDWNPHYDSDLSDLSDHPLSDAEEGTPHWAPTSTPSRHTEEVTPHWPPTSTPSRHAEESTPHWAPTSTPSRPENGQLGTPVCYICGGHDATNSIHVQKQEHSPETPFFPFLWLHTPPPGAQPITQVGSAQACDSCYSSLIQQWHSFDMANVPVLQRLYVVPLHTGGASDTGTLSRPSDPQHKGACYLCGEDCSNQGKLVRSRITNGNAKSTMHFPFIAQMPCPPGSRGVTQQGEVQSCRKCFGVLEDIWAIYRASLNEELINSVQSFLGRYHQVFTSTDPSPSAANRKAGTLSSHLLHTSICYVCGAELGPGSEYQLSINPPSRYVDKEPFFPFLTVYPPAPKARPPDSTGLVSTCGLCYHDLLGQWFQHEMRTQQPSSPWSRQYQVESFACFFCRQEKKRMLGLKTVQLARLPIFLLAPKVANSLFVDDGKQLLIGACSECRPLAMVGINMANTGSTTSSSPPVSQTSSVVSRVSGPVGSAAQLSEPDQPSKPVKEQQQQPAPSLESSSNVESAEHGVAGMNHEPKSPSVGMLSTATRTTATVSPLTPSPLNGALVPNGSPAASSALSVQSAPSSSFAAALRKLAKQAEEPRGYTMPAVNLALK